MFTGLVEAVGRVSRLKGDSHRLTLAIESEALASGLSPGDSIAVDGVCLTVTNRTDDEFEVDAVGTTIGRTTIGLFEVGRRVNLERSLRAGSPMGGHIVQGHVDGVGTVVGFDTSSDESLLRIELPDDVLRFTVPRGSLTVDGVSLTVAELAGNVAQMAIIPYTLGQTNFSRLEASTAVNLEADLIGKYVAALMRPYS